MNAAIVPILLLPSEVAERFRLPTRKVERMARTGGLPHICLPDGSILFDESELAEWLREHRSKGVENE